MISGYDIIVSCYVRMSNIWKILDRIISKVCYSSKSKLSIILKPLLQTLLTLTVIEKPKLNKTDKGETAEVERKKVLGKFLDLMITQELKRYIAFNFDIEFSHNCVSSLMQHFH